jgi:hypothetical protein
MSALYNKNQYPMSKKIPNDFLICRNFMASKTTDCMTQ